jgi:hypothetical protein
MTCKDCPNKVFLNHQWLCNITGRDINFHVQSNLSDTLCPELEKWKPKNLKSYKN